MASASASVIYVDLSSDSEDEQSPPEPKRRRLEEGQHKGAGTGLAQAFRKALPNKLVNIQKASLPGGGATLPSGLTVTKHTNNNNISINKIPCNGSSISMILPGGVSQLQTSPSSNISNIKQITNNNAIKQVKPVPSQKIAWSMAQKVPSPNVMLPSIPRHQVKVTPVLKSFGNPNLPATTPSSIKLTSLPAVKLQKTLVVNKLPTLQNSHLAPLQRKPQTPQQQPAQPEPMQHIQKQLKSPAPILSKSQPATSVRNLKQGPNLSLSKTATLNCVGTGVTHTGNFTTKSLASFSTGPPINTTNVMSTAARTLPFRSTSLVQRAAPSLAISMAASATPPLRLLATPPHSAAALNEPLLLNLPPTTSITPQLTPTTTPPPTHGLSIHAMNQQQQLSKGSTFKLSALPGASLSPVSVTVSKAKRIQPITVLKKSDEEWRNHVIGQQQKLSKDQPLSTPPTIVLVESPPTTPPTEKPESERARGKVITPTAAATATQKLAIKKPKIISGITTNPVKTTLKKEQPANLEKKKYINPEQTIVNLVDPIEKEQVKPELRKEQSPRNDPQSNTKQKSPTQPPPMIPEYAELLQLSRETDKSSDMERLIDIKLIKYYNNVHEKFVKSRGFRKVVQLTIEKIKNDPEMIYLHLKGVVDELRVRRKGKTITAIDEKEEDNTIPEKQSNEPLDPTESTETSLGDKRMDDRIRKLNRTLYTITKKITALEEADVDWNDDDDSSYLQVERFKKRACQIYEKICDLTGENKSAHSQLKQPFVFKDSPYPQFNRTLSLFVNRMQEFPDYHDVLRLLEHCNKEKDLGLANFEMKRIAHDAFVKVGRLLQARRKTDLYETVTHFTANAKDPAAADPELLAKLNENHKKQTKISDVLAKYAREQDLTAEEHREARLKEKLAKAAQKSALEGSTTTTQISQNDDDEDDDKPCTSAQARARAMNGLLKKMQLDEEKGRTGEHEEEEDGDTSSDGSEDEEDVDAFVDNFKENGEVSEAESDAEEDRPGLSEPKTTADVIDDRTTRVKTDAAAVPTNEKFESMSNGKLKIMSVSSLNASLHQTNTKGPEKKPLEKISAEIIISDEES
ncbi:LOW QUALITY PROTEIN: daxx-like protein [Drosophila tropicalis]|uniref:LOW QUALITY PROTEIN: daxx-like protein n=1 Tax=Drosophila tropicalis TaxID=46794 RepID=UPI0035ABB65A